MSRLLILACSQRKRTDREVLPAMERYDGPAYQVLRRYLRQVPLNPPTTYVLSAEFGLISAAEPILWYDRRMTPDRAAELEPAVSQELRRIARCGPFAEAFVAAGKDYLRALDRDALALAGQAVIVADGRIGVKLRKLRDWLHTNEDSSHLALSRSDRVAG